MRSIVPVLAMLVAPSLQAQQSGMVPDSTIQAIIKARVDAKYSAGIVVGVIDPDGKRHVLSYGTSGTARPLDGNSVFEIGSITKTFTASLLADMVTRGEVRLEDPVAKYLPASVKVPSRNGKEITLIDLATQSSGLPGDIPNMKPADSQNPFADYTVAQLYEFLGSYALPRDPGASYEYSNVGVGLLGHVLALRLGLPYEDAIRRRVLDPLHLLDTRIALTLSMRSRLALGHNQGGDVVPNWDLPTLAGAGALRSTANDMLTYIAANMAADVDSTRGPLAAALHMAHVRRRPAIGLMGIGLAWHHIPISGTASVVWHNGGTAGYRTFAGYNPVTHVGVVVLTNSGESEDDIGLHLLVPAMPLAPPQRSSWIGKTTVPVAPAVLDRYVGEYAMTPAFHLVVTREGTGIALQATGQPKIPLFATSSTEFFAKLVDAVIIFQTDSTGRATGLVLRQNGHDQPAPRVP
jgi:D-alanyl-D-alanine-carboxypeptidase/D-alanyl-D-alanine-endopeptidase